MNRVIVTNPFMGLTGMQVCAVKDATDEEILTVCNRDNYAGTTNGWTTVYRDDSKFGKTAPVQCEGHEDRLHFIVSC
jgi:hypothetical protein